MTTESDTGSMLKGLVRPLSVLLVIVLIALFFSPILTNTFVKSQPITFAQQSVKDASTELGSIVNKQDGINGVRTTIYTQPQSLFNRIFGRAVTGKITATSSKITKQPVTEIISSGSKKYQYMYCSNGSYRYYTDAQFQDAITGFTHKSKDFCAQNNEGTLAQLANTPPASITSFSASTAPTTAMSLLPIPNCNTTSIPYGIDYQNVSWLPVGQTQTYPGLNGTYFSCLGTSVQPVNKTIYTGIAQSNSMSTQQVVSQEEARSLVIQKCNQQYSSAVAQINAAGASSSSAMDIVNSLNSQCLSAAGR